ncbi:hypothetical protein K2173_006529 [Erythroxylum novogranatense]|uniref:ABC transmembrane type-1 domain-containing protein n=1 Tax=Erythroxylum novogranatense TaxID=1862640 RepID=A0AAV8T5E5_9ROSI|nr:hypothetical protein K2173_006529 [Erythroxylum novogranatense]
MAAEVGKFIQLMTTFISGFVIAFIKGWRLAVVLLSCIPVLALAGGVMGTTMTKMATIVQASYAEAGNVVEQTVGGIRTVVSFTGEKHATGRYNEKLKTAYKAAVLQGLASGLGMGVIMFIVYSSYGLATWYGSKLIIEKGYNGGNLITVIFNLMTSGM